MSGQIKTYLFSVITTIKARMTRWSRTGLACIILAIVGPITLFGILGHSFMPHSLPYNRFIAWEIAAILMSLIINFIFFFKSDAWQIAFYITGEENKPFTRASSLFWLSFFLLGIAALMIIVPFIIYVASPEYEKPLKQWVKMHEVLLLSTRVSFILVASICFGCLDLYVSNTASDAKKKIEALIKTKSTMDKGRLLEKIRNWLKLKDETRVTYKQVEKFIGMLSSSFKKSCLFNDLPVCIGFFILLLNILLIAMGRLEKCPEGEEGELCIWICGACAFQMMFSGIVFGVITWEIFKETQQLKKEVLCGTNSAS
jgi:hypothetical protein